MSDETTTGVVTFPGAAGLQKRARKKPVTREEDLQGLVDAQAQCIENLKKTIIAFHRSIRAQRDRIDAEQSLIWKAAELIAEAAELAKRKKWKDLTRLLNGARELNVHPTPAASVADLPAIMMD